ncbi:MAG: hypothetical protein LBP50_06370 [Tannerella sp.]|jgi:hypothetical protein|nr:hypothetical protein [Tannerella sp.]
MRKKETTTGNRSGAGTDLIVVARNIVKAWKKRPAYTLFWINPKQLDQSVRELETGLKGKTVKEERSLPTRDIKDLNLIINRHLVHVKGYLMDSFSKKEAQTHYARFGIVKLSSGRYGFPVDGEQRLHALQQLVKALATSEFRDRRYGYRHWKNILARFKESKSLASYSALPQDIRQKTEQKEMVRQTLNALILLIRANHPQHWRNELSAWGFRKEQY